jgi:hypothetical protein
MEIRYCIDVGLPDSGLSSLDLVTELYSASSIFSNAVVLPELMLPKGNRLNKMQLDLISVSIHWPFTQCSSYTTLNPLIYRRTKPSNILKPKLKNGMKILCFRANNCRHDAFYSPTNDPKPGPVQQHLQVTYEAFNLLIHRPFLTHVLNHLSDPNCDPLAIPSSISIRSKRAIDVAVKQVSLVRTLRHLDWFSLKQVFMGTVLVVAAARIMGDDMTLQQNARETLDGATEIFARTAKKSDSASRALRLMSDIRLGMKWCSI